MFIIGLGTAFPPQRYLQAEGWAALEASDVLPTLAPRSRAILKKVLLGDNGIASRHLALDALSDALALTPDILHARFARHAPELATQAGVRALESARIRPAKVDAVLVATCTGYLCPGLTSYVAERLGLRDSVTALDLVGLGCGAALPVLAQARALLLAGGARQVLCICVEVCSAALYLDDDPGVLVSACLFGDGAAAVVCAAEPAPHARRLRWHTNASRLVPSERENLRFETRGGMLRNILTADVPATAARHVGALAADMLREAGLGREQIRAWILHPGGRDVLLELEWSLGLGESDLRHSAAVLRDHGNMSSPSVLFVLADALAADAPAGWWWLSAFGAGFSAHGALVEAS
jgi:alkylresorcinol/alkylpyrone synthase